MVDNEEAVAQLLYTIWSGEGGKAWTSLPTSDLARWQRLVRFMMSREIALTLKFANERYYSDFTKKLVTRIETWQKESGLYKQAQASTGT